MQPWKSMISNFLSPNPSQTPVRYRGHTEWLERSANTCVFFNRINSAHKGVRQLNTWHSPIRILLFEDSTCKFIFLIQK